MPSLLVTSIGWPIMNVRSVKITRVSSKHLNYVEPLCKYIFRRFMKLYRSENEIYSQLPLIYEGCSNMNASGFITFFTYMLRQNIIPFWKELFVAFKMAPNIKKQSLYFSSYRSLYKTEVFCSKLKCTFLLHVRI